MTAPTTATTPTSMKVKLAGTSYIVLERVKFADNADVSFDGKECYAVLTTIAATSAEAAIRKSVDNNKTGGTYIAVPARSWTPTTVKVETKTHVTLEGGK